MQKIFFLTLLFQAACPWGDVKGNVFREEKKASPWDLSSAVL